MTAIYSERDQLKAELLFHATKFADQALKWAAHATVNALAGDEDAASGYQYLVDTNSDDAIQSAYESGQIAALAGQEDGLDDQEAIGTLDEAGRLIELALDFITEAQSLDLEGHKTAAKAELLKAQAQKELALKEAFTAGLRSGSTQRDGDIPTFTLG